MVVGAYIVAIHCHIGQSKNLEVQSYEIDVLLSLRGVPGKHLEVHDTCIVFTTGDNLQRICQGYLKVVLI